MNKLKEEVSFGFAYRMICYLSDCGDFIDYLYQVPSLKHFTRIPERTIPKSEMNITKNTTVWQTLISLKKRANKPNPNRFVIERQPIRQIVNSDTITSLFTSISLNFVFYLMFSMKLSNCSKCSCIAQWVVAIALKLQIWIFASQNTNFKILSKIFVKYFCH